MVIRMMRAGFSVFLLATLLLGCTIELRSPIKIGKPKEKEEASPPPRVVYAPPPPAPTAPPPPQRAPVTPYPQQPTIIAQQPVEQPRMMPVPSGQTPTTGVFSPEQIVILSAEYLANTRYVILGKVFVKDVSENGFSKNDGKEGLKYEAFRQYGGQARGITNVTYEGETSFFGSERYYEASGDVITWEEGSTAPTSDVAMLPQRLEETYPAREETRATVPAFDVQPLETEGPTTYQQPVQEPYSTGVSTPRDIVILAKKDLLSYSVWTLGKVSVSSDEKKGFEEEEALQELKVEAFRQYGSNARGITNVTYETKRGRLNPLSKKIIGASGEVVTWQESVAAPAPAYVQPLQPQPTTAYQQPEPYAPAQGGIASPANILILSDEDLVGYDFWILGKISVQSKSKDGFDKDRANRALKAEAFRKFGGNARGIVNVTYDKKRGLLNMRSSNFRGAAGNVVTWEGAKTVAPQKQQVLVQPPPPTRQAPGVSAPAPAYSPRTTPLSGQGYTPTNILVLSPDDLVTMNFRSLGRIKATDKLGNAFDKKSAVKALKVAAFKQYGTQARGITNIDFKRKQGIFNYGKFNEVYADVITWDSEQAPPPQVPEPMVTPLPPTATIPVPAPDASAEVAVAPLPDYTTEVVSYENIMILDVDELLTPNYKTLGMVTVKAPSRHGFREFEANTALQRESLNKFGGRVRALINVEYARASTFHSTSDKVTSATGEAITW